MQGLPFDSIANDGFKKDLATEEFKNWLIDEPQALSSQDCYRVAITDHRDIKKARIASLQFD
ncbi:MAG TPA: hypothetical protein DCS35_08730 [Vibrio sp.]|nr:hypothetical protein [Vibrio sp.]